MQGQGNIKWRVNYLEILARFVWGQGSRDGVSTERCASGSAAVGYLPDGPVWGRGVSSSLSQPCSSQLLPPMSFFFCLIKYNIYSWSTCCVSHTASDRYRGVRKETYVALQELLFLGRTHSLEA